MNLQKLLVNHIQNPIKRTIYHDCIEVIPKMQGWFNIQNQSMQYTTLKNEGKNKTEFLFFWCRDNVSDKNLTTFHHKKTFKNLRPERKFLNMIKGIMKNPELPSYLMRKD